MRHISLLSVLLLSAGALAAQELAGRIEGTVSDAQGAVVPNAQLTATHSETNTAYRAVTSAAGRFAIPNVRLGRYTVATELTGFRRAVVEDVLVEVGGTASLNIQLEVGALLDQVTVTSEVAQGTINTVNAELGAVVDNRRVLELPLNGRNAAHLALQQAGVYFERNPDGQGEKLIVHGQRHRSLNISLDGIDTQDNYNRASSVMLDQPLLALAAENVQEFRVITGLGSAEFSRGGAQITAVTRGGSNRFHGSLFNFHRNHVLNANDFFNNSARPAVERSPLIRNQFGGRLGGPIVRDRTFFFLGYQQTRESRGIPVNREVYTAEARRGLFRFLDNATTTPENVAANPGLIRSVNLLECSSAAQAAFGRGCLDGRFQPSAPPTLDSFITGTVFGIIPLPNNFAIGDGLNTGGFRFNAKSTTAEHLPSTRLDHRLNGRHNFYATFNYIDRGIDGDYINGREPPYPAQGALGLRTTHSRGFSGAVSSTFSPTFINEFRAGWLGGENAFPRLQPFGTPFTLDLNTIYDPYDSSGNLSSRDNVTMHLRDSVSWIRGKHQLKFGAEWRHRWVDNYNFSEVNPYGEIDLDDDNNPPGFSEAELARLAGARAIRTTDGERARDLINNLVGAVTEVEMRYNVTSLTSGFVPGAPERRIYQNREFDAFFQDTWSVRHNLTLNLGLRWEYATVPYETQRLALMPEGGVNAVFGVSGPGGFFNPGTFNGTPCPFLGRLPAAATTANASALITSCATQFVPGTSSNGRPIWKNDLNNFGPVVSFAWDPFGDGKTSVRAGYRISYMQDAFAAIDGNLDDNEGLQVDQDCIPVDGNCQANPTLLRNVLSGPPPVAAPPPFVLPVSRSILDSATNDFRTYDPNLATPYYQEWTFGIQREIARNWAVELRYVGNRGLKLRRVADFNEINVNARDSATGQTFLDSFVLAQRNLACNQSSGAGRRFDDASGAACIVPNPLMTALIASDATRLRAITGLVNALDYNEPGQFVHRLTQADTSAPAAAQARIRGGSFWGSVLAGRLPVNFFQANPFVASARAMVNDGFSTYHSLEVEVRRRFARGFTLQSNYTFGKALADYDGDANELLNDVRPSSVRNPRYMIQQIMPRHQLNANWFWELPLGRGRLRGGWQTGGILNWRSGRPQSIVSMRGTFHRQGVSGSNTVDLARPMTNGQIRELVGQLPGDGIFWWDPCLSSQLVGTTCRDPNAVAGLFELPKPGRLGELPQTVVYGPRRFAVDVNLVKRVPVRESVDFELRWELFNVFNNANFNVPVNDIFSASFGQVIRTVTNPRLMQVALKINF